MQALPSRTMSLYNDVTDSAMIVKAVLQVPRGGKGGLSDPAQCEYKVSSYKRLYRVTDGPRTMAGPVCMSRRWIQSTNG